jgi:large subunit ribosomal protein L30
MAGSLRITLRKSTVSTTQRARGTVRALGLDRIGDTVVQRDDAVARGMIQAVRYLVSVEELEASVATAPRPSRRRSTPAAAGTGATTDAAPAARPKRSPSKAASPTAAEATPTVPAPPAKPASPARKTATVTAKARSRPTAAAADPATKPSKGRP